MISVFRDQEHSIHITSPLVPGTAQYPNTVRIEQLLKCLQAEGFYIEQFC